MSFDYWGVVTKEKKVNGTVPASILLFLFTRKNKDKDDSRSKIFPFNPEAHHPGFADTVRYSIPLK